MVYGTTMSEKKPLDKKPIRDLLSEKDAFLTTSEKIQEYLLRHTKGVIITVAAVALAVIATALYLSHQDKAERQATVAYENSLAKLAESESDGLAALEKVRADFAGRKASRLAAYRLLGLYIANKDVDKALPLAEDLLKTLKPAETALKPVLLNNLGGLYEEKKDYQQAARSYETLLAIDYLGPNLKLSMLMSLGRVYAAADRKDDAVRNYEQVIREYPQSFQAFMANSKLSELKGVPVAFPLVDDLLTAAAEASVSAEAPSAALPAAEDQPDAVAAPDSGLASGGTETSGEQDGGLESGATEMAGEQAAPADEGTSPGPADSEEVDVEEGAPLPPNVAPHEDQADGQAAPESGAE